MPSKKTKNGVDLSQIDVSSLTLVDKEDLLDELSKKLSAKVHKIFEQATDTAAEELDELLKDKMAGGGGVAPQNPAASSGGGGSRPPRTPRKSTGGPDDNFEKILRAQAEAKESINKLDSIQKKKDKDKLAKQQRGNVYSDTGKRHAERIDNMASEYHTYTKDELEKAKKELSDIHEGVRTSTFGTENKILTNATLSLQKALEQETRQRTSTLGKLGTFMQKQNIDAVSIISGLAGHSPIVGLATKYILEKVRDRREERQKKKTDQFKVGDIKKRLPRPDQPLMDDEDIKYDYETARDHFRNIKDEHHRHEAIERAHALGKIPGHRDKLRAELLRPDYQPLHSPSTATGLTPPVMPPPLPGQTTPTSPTPAASTPAAPSTAPQQILRDHLGNAVPDWEGYRKSTPKKQQQQDEQDAWMNMMRGRGMSKMQKEWEENKNKPSAVPDWPELFGDEKNPKPTALAHLEKREAERIKNPYNSPVKPIVVPPVTPILQMPKPVQHMAAAAAAEILPIDHIAPKSPTLHKEEPEPPQAQVQSQGPERVGVGNTSGLLSLMENIQKDQDKKLSILSDEKTGPFSKLEKLNQEQLDELKTINKQLAKQIDQADLDKNARERETKDGDGAGLLADVAHDKTGGKGGLLGGLMSGIEMGIGKLLGGKLGKWLGIGNKGAKGAEGAAEAEESGGLFKRWFGKGKGTGKAAGSAVEGVEGGAKGVGEIGKVVGEGAEAVGKSGGKLLGEGSELLKGAKFLGEGGRLAEFLDFIPVVGEVIMAITAIFDFVPAFLHAEKYLGDKKKLTMLDKTAAGLGGVIEGLFGIIDFITGLFGVKTEIGKILGKTTAKTFAAIFSAIGSIFGVLYKIAQPIFKILGPILEFVANRLGKAIEILGDFFEGFGKFIDGLGDLTDPKTFDKGIGELKDGIFGMFKALGNWFLHMLGLDLIKDGMDWVVNSFKGMFKNLGDEIMKIPGMSTIKKAYDAVGAAFSSVFQSVKDMVKNIIGPDNYKILTDALQSITDSIKSVLDWISDKIDAILHPFGGGKKNKEAPKPAAAAAAPAPTPSAPPPVVNAPAPAPAPAPRHHREVRTGGEGSRMPELTTPSPTAAPTTSPKPTSAPAPTPTPSPGPSSAPELSKTTTGLYTPTSPKPTTPQPAPSPTAPTPDKPVQAPSGVSPQGGSGIGVGGGGVSGPYKISKLTAQQQQNIDLLTKELKSQGMNDKQIAAILGNVEKETGYTNKEENLNYAHTSNDRIRSIFGPARTNMSDQELDALKKDPQKFAEHMYGKDTKIGSGMGNTEEGDGWKFRGRGFIGITGRNNYSKLSQAVFGDDRLVKNPELLNDPQIAAKATVAYLKMTGESTAKRMGIDLKNGSQKDVNLAYTSAIAGRPIQAGQGYLGTEILGKVNTYASRFTGPQQVGAPGATTNPMPTLAALQPPSPPPAAPRLDTPKLSAESTGMQLAQASAVNSELNRQPGTTNTGHQIIAPTNNVTNNNTTTMADLRTKNTDTSYERNQNQMYVPT